MIQAGATRAILRREDAVNKTFSLQGLVSPAPSMQARLQTLSLLMILIIVSAALGLAFGPLGQGGLGQYFANQQSTSTGRNHSPDLLVRAAAVGSQQGLSTAGSTSVLAPLAKLNFVVTAILSGRSVNRAREPTYNMVTNSSGEVEASLPAGNYSVQGLGADFTFLRDVSLEANHTTILTMDVVQVVNPVSTLAIVNQDTLSGLESTGVIYVEVDGNFQYNSSSFYELIGTIEPGGPSSSNGSMAVQVSLLTPVTIEGIVSGAYDSPGGFWIVMHPSAPVTLLPNAGFSLMHYAANSTVSLVAD